MQSSGARLPVIHPASACLSAVFAWLLISSQAGAHATDSDHDGVPDSADRCPDTAQLEMLPADFRFAPAVNQERLKSHPQAHPVDRDGCEFDTDNDGVVNSRDYCPDDSTEAISHGVAENGCPGHSDRDGTPDYRDKCPGTPANVKTDGFGCQTG